MTIEDSSTGSSGWATIGTFTTVTDTRVSGTCATGDQLFRVKAVFEVPAAGSGDFVTKYGAWVLPGSTSTAIRNPGFLRSAVFQKQ
mgnify:CR=1 FL=1